MSLGSATDESFEEEVRRITRSSVNRSQRQSPRGNVRDGPSTSRAAGRERGEESRMVARKSTSRQQELLSMPARGAARRKRKTYRQLQVQQIREMIKLQKSTALQIPKAAFGRVVREITQEFSETVTHYTVPALEALQEATEMFITQVLQDAYMLTLHRQCVTLAQKDMVLLRALKPQML